VRLSAPQQRLVAEHAGLGDQATLHLHHDDRVGIANLAVVAAAVRFDPAAGATFATFAGKRAVGAVRDRRRTDTRIGRRHLSVMHLLDLADQSTADNDTAAAVCGVEVAVVADARAAFDRGLLLRLDAPVGDGETSLADLHCVAPDHAEAVTDRVMLVTELGRLPDRERAVLVLRFFGGWAMGPIARMQGVTESRISQIQREALAKMREQIR